jgi:Ca2+-binding EF-hand superfamily protein
MPTPQNADMTLFQVAFEERKIGLGLSDQDGSLVVASATGPAEESGVIPGDVVLEVAGFNLARSTITLHTVQQLIKSQPRPLVFKFSRDAQNGRVPDSPRKRLSAARAADQRLNPPPIIAPEKCNMHEAIFHDGALGIGLTQTDGLMLVQSVAPDGQGHREGIAAGDIIVAVGQVQVYGSSLSKNALINILGSMPRPLKFSLARTYVGYFEKFDRDGNGAVDAEEFAEVLADMGYACTPEQIEGIIRKYDNDGNGSIDYGEFVRFASELDGRQGAVTPISIFTMGKHFVFTASSGEGVCGFELEKLDGVTKLKNLSFEAKMQGCKVGDVVESIAGVAVAGAALPFAEITRQIHTAAYPLRVALKRPYISCFEAFDQNKCNIISSEDFDSVLSELDLQQDPALLSKLKAQCATTLASEDEGIDYVAFISVLSDVINSRGKGHGALGGGSGGMFSESVSALAAMEPIAAQQTDAATFADMWHKYDIDFVDGPLGIGIKKVAPPLPPLPSAPSRLLPRYVSSPERRLRLTRAVSMSLTALHVVYCAPCRSLLVLAPCCPADRRHHASALVFRAGLRLRSPLW